MPQLLVLQRASSYPWRHGSRQTRSEPVDQATVDWQAAVAALGKVLASEARHGMRVHIAVSDLWVRSQLLPATSVRLSENEMQLLARTHFARQYPEGGQHQWTLRLALQGTRLLAAGMAPELMEGIKAINTSAGTKLCRMEPLFSWVFDRFEKTLAATSGWMLLDEPGMLTLAYVEKGRLLSLHSQRCGSGRDEIALLLLERQSALLGQQSVEVRIFSVATRLVRLPAPWRIVWQQRVFDFDDSMTKAPATAPLMQ